MDYDVWYAGMVIGNIKADTDRKAQNAVDKLYSKSAKGTPTACRTNATDEQFEAAKKKSLEPSA